LAAHLKESTPYLTTLESSSESLSYSITAPIIFALIATAVANSIITAISNSLISSSSESALTISAAPNSDIYVTFLQSDSLISELASPRKTFLSIVANSNTVSVRIKRALQRRVITSTSNEKVSICLIATVCTQ